MLSLCTSLLGGKGYDDGHGGQAGQVNRGEGR